jgi:hypothetical protein
MGFLHNFLAMLKSLDCDEVDKEKEKEKEKIDKVFI